MADDEYQPPIATLGDHAHTLTRAGIASIPIVGGTAIELFQAIIAPPLQKRQVEWMETVAEGLLKLKEAQRCVVEQLGQNDAFIDTVLQASQAAVQTAQQEKREALRNAVLNSALPDPPDETLRQVFVSLVNAFSGLHVRILRFLDDPQAWYERHGKQPPREPPQTLWALIQHAMPELSQKQPICQLVCHDLNSRQLLTGRSITDPVPDIPSPPGIGQATYSSPANATPGTGPIQYSGPTAVREWTTDFGRQFLKFIASPIED